MASVKTGAGSFSLGDNATVLIVGGGLALAYFGIIKPVLAAGGTVAEALNLKDTKDEIDEKKAIKINEVFKGWNPNFYKTCPPTTLLPTQQNCIAWCRNMLISKGYNILVDDDEEKIYGLLRLVKSQAHLSRYSEFFFNAYKQGLYDFLKDTLDWQSEMATVARITNPLPKYILGKK